MRRRARDDRLSRSREFEQIRIRANRFSNVIRTKCSYTELETQSAWDLGRHNKLRALSIKKSRVNVLGAFSRLKPPLFDDCEILRYTVICEVFSKYRRLNGTPVVG